MRELDDQVIAELAETLALGEDIPESLQSAWAEACASPEALARIEEYRAWWLQLSAASRAAAAESVTLSVERDAGTLRVAQVKAAGLLQARLALPEAGPRAPSEATTCIRIGEVRIDIVSVENGLQVSLAGPAQRISGVRVRALAPDNREIASSATNSAGIAIVRCLAEPLTLLELLWPQHHQAGDEITHL